MAIKTTMTLLAVIAFAPYLQVEYRLYIHPQTQSNLIMTLGSGPDVWFYMTMVWSVGAPFKIYENGQWAEDGDWATNSAYTRAVNTVRTITFGRQYVDLDQGHATAYIDGVRIFNRPLSAAEVLALYNSY